MTIIIPIIAVTGIGLLCAVMLSVASSVMEVKVDERVAQVRECLPGANCGSCGYTGCDGYAKAVVELGAKTNLCIPGADATSQAIADVLGVEAEEVVEQVAVVSCRGDCDHSNKKYRYQKRFADAAMEILYSYVWPGNVRELKNVVEQAVILSAGDEIQPSELPIACRFEGESHGGDETGRVNLKLEVARFEYEYICRAYEKYGTVRAAAASLGMDSATFVRKRRKFEELLQK